jgi:hypothetical protein
MSSKKRKSVGAPLAASGSGPAAAPSTEEQRKRAKLWMEERRNAEAAPVADTAAKAVAAKPAAAEAEAVGAKKPNKRTSLSAVPAPRPAPAAKAPASSRKSLAPEALSRRGAGPPAKGARPPPSPTASPSPPPKRAKAVTATATAAATAVDVEEQKQKAKVWRDNNLAGKDGLAAAPAAPSGNRRKSVGAERTPQPLFVESDIPEDLRPSRPSSSAAKQPTPQTANRRASLSAMKSPAASTLRGPAARIPVAGAGAGAGTQAAGMGSAARVKKPPTTPEYFSPSEGEEEEEDAPPARPAGRKSSGGKPAASTRVSFSAARRSSSGAAYGEATNSHPADFRHQFVDRGAGASGELSSPGSSAGGLTPLLNRAGSGTPSTVRSGRRGSKSSVKKVLIPSDSDSDSAGEEGGGAVLSFSEQKKRAVQWRDSSLGGDGGREKAAGGAGAVQCGLVADDPNAIEEAEASGSIAPRQLKTLQQQKREAWLGEVLCFLGGVAGVAAFIAMRVAAAGAEVPLSLPMSMSTFLPLSLPLSLPLYFPSLPASRPLLPSLAPWERAGAQLTGTYFSAVDTFNNGLELTVSSLRTVCLALLALAVALPVGYGIFTMIMWFWTNAQRKAKLIESMADEAKELLSEKYGGGPYPVAFLMEFLMDKYRREGSGKATELLAPGETLNRAAFRRLWPSVQREVTADSRIEVLTRTHEGKPCDCWRVVGVGVGR